MNARSLRRRARAATFGAALAGAAVVAGCAPMAPSGPALGFTPITTPPLACSATGPIKFAPDMPAATQLTQSGDPATPVNAPAASNKVGRVNDMIALSPDGKYLYTTSENGNPSENGALPTDSDGVTRLELATGKKEILADNVDPTSGKNLWSRVDGVKWYPYGLAGASGTGVLLISEEFATGGIWQVNPDTGSFVRLDWLGNFSHEGIGLDGAGNLYLGDENRAGGIYKAVPNDVNDLTKGGTLYFLVGTGIDASGWKQVANPAAATAEAQNLGGILFDRPEDFDEHNGRVYFTVTEPKGDAETRKGNFNGTAAGGADASQNQVVNRGGVYSLNTTGVPDLSIQSGATPAGSGATPRYNKLTPMIEVNDPTYATQADAKAQQGLQFPDNIAFDGYGNLWVHEDIPDNNGTFPASGIDVSKQARDQQDELYVYVLNAAGDATVPNPDSTGPGVSGGYKVADMQSSNATHPCENEFTGGVFAADGKTLYINQQHWENPTVTSKIN